MKLPVSAVVIALSFSAFWVSPAEAAAAARPYDFNGDGYPELVVGAPGLRVGSSAAGAGGVVVFPASARGLSLTERVISQSTRGVPGASEGQKASDNFYDFEGDRFGSALASADFNRDGYADLAVGQPGENGGAGAVTIIYGSSGGLDTRRSRRVGGISDGRFGSALVAGDFNRDGFPDLAVGAPTAESEEILGTGSPLPHYISGTVTVLSAGPGGLSSAGPVIFHRQAGAQFDVAFGAKLAAGDLDEDGKTDLIVQSAGAYDDHYSHPGSISYCLGRVGGQTGCTRLVYLGDDADVQSMAVGDISGDHRPEIVVGLPFSENIGYGGAVRILQLRAGTPLSVARQETLTQNSRGVPGTNEVGDGLGSSVALGDIDRDGYADLAIGAIGENHFAGRVTVVHGAATGWRTRGNYFYDQDTPGIPGKAEEGDESESYRTGDRFGSDVSLHDYNRDGRLDLTMSAGGENSNSGAITTLRGSGRRFTTNGARTFGLATLRYAHPTDALFGSSLSQ